MSHRHYIRWFSELSQDIIDYRRRMTHAQPQASVAEISEQLRVEEERLNGLKESLTRSKRLKQDMLGILDSFEHRLETLEAAVLPLYEQTSKLQRRQFNITKTMKSVDSTLGYYKIANEMDTILRDSDPSEDVDRFLKQMDKLKEAMKFFGKDISYADQLENISSSFEMSCSALEREFRELLQRGSISLKPDTVFDCLDDNFEVSSIARLELMPETTVESLKKITHWLLNNVSSTDFLNSYADVRGKYIHKQLLNIQESRKMAFTVSAFTGTLKTVSSSPKLDKKQRSNKISYDFVRKVSKAYTSDQGYKRANTMAALDPMTDFPGEQEAELFMILLGCFDALFQAECDLMQKIVSNTRFEAKLQRRIVVKPLNLVLTQGEVVVDMVRKAAMKQESKCILCILPVAKYLHNHFSQLDSLSKNAHSELNSKFTEVYKSIDSLCVKTLEEFVDTVKSDQIKSAPPDGTVHQVTSNTISFLTQLMEHRQSLQLLFADGAQDSAKVAVPKLFARILSALGLNLRNKAACYADPSLRALFMLNNYNHSLKSLHLSGVLKMVCEQNREVENYYLEQVKEYKRQFLTCWDRVLTAFSEYRGDASPAVTGRIGEKEREQLKNAFSSFNREFESVCQAQREYTVPDLELAADIKRHSREMVLPKYQNFYHKFHTSGFAKNPEKYLRYKPEDVALMIDRLFDASA